MLLLLFAGVKAGSGPPPPAPGPSVLVSATCAYATEDLVSVYGTEDTAAVYAPAECFVPHGGWPDTLRRKAPREAIERLLRLQRDASFGSRWFAEFEEAQRDFARKDVRAALAIGAQQAREVAEEIERSDSADYQHQLGDIALGLQVATQLKAHKDALEAARFAEQTARNLKAWLAEQDDEEILLLMD